MRRRCSECCLHGTDYVAPKDFVLALDRIAGRDVFSTLYERYTASREFPSLADAYGQLGIGRSGNDLTFAETIESRRLRDAIMAPRP